MARQRRGGGFRPPELRGTLGTLLRTTLAQAGTLRDVLERGAREGRSRLDSALSNRRRHDALADLGDIVLDLIRRGEIDLGELPEVRDIVAHLDEIDAGTYDDAHDEQHDEPVAAPPVRNRFDARRPSPSSRSERDRAAPPAGARDRDDDTVSSRTWARPGSAAGSAKPGPAKSPPRVWRPQVDEITPPATPSARRNTGTADEVTRPGHPIGRKDPSRKGGIHFDDDEDLAEYMHPDDVPPKTPGDGDS